MTTKRGAHRSSKPIASSTYGAPGTSLAPRAAHSPPDSPPAAAGHRLAARIASEALGQLVEAPLEAAAPSRRRRPSAGRTRAARPRTAVRTSQSTSIAIARRPPRRAPRARPRRRRWWPSRPRVTITCSAPASTGGDDQLAGAARGGRPRVALVLGRPARARSPAPSPRSRYGRRRCRRERRRRSGGRADRTRDRAHLAAERASRAPPSCPRRRRRPAAPRPSRPAARSPRAIAAATSRGREGALEGVRRDQRRQLSQRAVAERPLRLVAVHGEHDPLERRPRARAAAPTISRAASSSGKPPTPVPNATSASERRPSSLGQRERRARGVAR